MARTLAHGGRNGRRRAAGLAPRAFVRRGHHDPQPGIKNDTGPAGKRSQHHAHPHVADGPAQVRGKAGAYARDKAVAAPDQRGPDGGGCHGSIQTRIRVARTAFGPEPGATQGPFRVSPSRAEAPRTEGSRYELANPHP
ncbi:hypothetical protein ARTSIC4J27_1215 [Pseudarthrobacter siccitolerans]|uniref:Uncharacterized protein n=1 Tax=Pseudarthrobacter siccitolerans TaxID=861266 RepID=A0A024H076_9MICC|nr:hypothetical protein ARTSIC4J27_1215 [Pseudarthrobacter siccitolerans]